METQDRRKNNQSGNGGVHVCNKCGWLFPNPHPSAKQRRSHKRVCGTIEVKSGNNGDQKTDLGTSINDSKTLVSGTMEKIEERTVSSRSISGLGSGSNRSTRSEDDVFSDAVADFPDGMISISDSDDARALHGEGSFAEVVSVEKESGKTDGNATDEGKTIAEEQQNPLVNTSLAEPSENPVKDSSDITTEALLEESNSAEEVSVEKETEITHSCATDTEEQNPLVNADTNAESALDDSENYSHTVSNVKVLDDDYVHENEDAEKFYSVEADRFKEVEEDLPLTNETSSMADICGKMAKNLFREEGDEDDHNVRGAVIEQLSESSPSLSEFEDPIDDSSDVQIKKLQDSEESVQDLGSPSELMVVGESASVGEEVNVVEKTHDLESCEHKASDSADVSLTEKVKDNDAQMEKIEVSSIKELGNEGNEVNAAEKTHDLESCVYKGSDCNDVSLTEKVKDDDDAWLERIEVSDVNESGHVGDEVDVAKTHDPESCGHKSFEAADVTLSEKVRGDDAHLEKIEASSVKELESVVDRASSEDCFPKVDLGLISDNDDVSEITQIAASDLNVGVLGEAVSSVEDRLTKERNGTASVSTEIQVDSVSQADSLEGNCGSVSVLSTLSDAPAATETGSLPSQESFKPEKPILQPKSSNGKSTLFQPQSSISPVEQKAADKTDQSQTSHKPEEPSGKKRSEEIIAKVTNWSTGKQHMPLKSYLGESSPGSKEDPPQMSEVINAVMAGEDQVDLSKEWNSPARYQSNIKRQKSKVKRPYWAPFICCSSVQTS